MPVASNAEEYLESVDILMNSEHYHKREIFTLLYIKMEEQMRKLLVFALRVPPHHIHYEHIAQYIDDCDTDVESCATDFSIFTGHCFRTAIGKGDFKEGKKRLKRMANLRPIRNPIFHGKMMKAQHYELFKDEEIIQDLRSWIVDVAEVMQSLIDFNGIRAMTYQKAIYESRKNYQFPKEVDHKIVVEYIKSVRAEHWKNLRITSQGSRTASPPAA